MKLKFIDQMFMFLHPAMSGQPIDGPQNGPAPLPWSIPADFPALFMNNTRKIEVPHTASVKVS